MPEQTDFNLFGVAPGSPRVLKASLDKEREIFDNTAGLGLTARVGDLVQPSVVLNKRAKKY